MLLSRLQDDIAAALARLGDSTVEGNDNSVDGQPESAADPPQNLVAELLADLNRRLSGAQRLQLRH